MYVRTLAYKIKGVKIAKK